MIRVVRYEPAHAEVIKVRGLDILPYKGLPPAREIIEYWTGKGEFYSGLIDDPAMARGYDVAAICGILLDGSKTGEACAWVSDVAMRAPVEVTRKVGRYLRRIAKRNKLELVTAYVPTHELAATTTILKLRWTLALGFEPVGIDPGAGPGGLDLHRLHWRP